MGPFCGNCGLAENYESLELPFPGPDWIADVISSGKPFAPT